MHPHHARALRASRKHVRNMAKTHSWALEKYDNIRQHQLHRQACGMHVEYEKLKAATVALEQITRDYLDVLAVGITVERLLEKA